MRTYVPVCFGSALLMALASACVERPTVVDPPAMAPVMAEHSEIGLEGPPLPASMVATGRGHACALGVDRRTYCWGNNTFGQLGDGSNISSTGPVPVAGGLHFVHLTSGGWLHTCGLTDQGQAYCWGWNPFGQLGDGTTTSSIVPVPVAGGLRFAHLDAGTYHTCGVTVTGEAYCWGANGPLIRRLGDRDSEGFALGAPTTEFCPNPDLYKGSQWPCSLKPVAVSGDISFRSISAGLWATCGVAVNSEGYCWGWNVLDQLGNGMVTDATAPTPVARGLLFEHLALGAAHGCGVVNRDAYCWGGRLPIVNWGSLGTGSFLGSSTPALVVGGLSFVSVIPSDANNIFTFTCGLATDGAAYCWGANHRGQLGTDAVLAACLSPPNPPCTNQPVGVASGMEFISLATGAAFACGVGLNRAVYCWGRNDNGQLGDGTTTDRSTPVLVQAPDRSSRVLAGQAAVEATLIP